MPQDTTRPAGWIRELTGWQSARRGDRVVRIVRHAGSGGTAQGKPVYQVVLHNPCDGFRHARVALDNQPFQGVCSEALAVGHRVLETGWPFVSRGVLPAKERPSRYARRQALYKRRVESPSPARQGTKKHAQAVKRNHHRKAKAPIL